MALDPTNGQHSIGRPTRCEISAIGLMSSSFVRTAQFARTRKPAVLDLARQPLDITGDVGTRARQPKVGRVNPERVDEVENLDLALDGGSRDRWRLQAVAQRLVIEKDGAGRSRSLDVIPVVDQGMHGRLDVAPEDVSPDIARRAP